MAGPDVNKPGARRRRAIGGVGLPAAKTYCGALYAPSRESCAAAKHMTAGHIGDGAGVQLPALSSHAHFVQFGRREVMSSHGWPCTPKLYAVSARPARQAPVLA